MSDVPETAEKIHYICQTYIEFKDARGGLPSLKVDKRFQYTTESAAKDRAERENQRKGCEGADAYMVDEDEGSGEVSSPTFIVRLGNVPEDDS